MIADLKREIPFGVVTRFIVHRDLRHERQRMNFGGRDSSQRNCARESTLEAEWISWKLDFRRVFSSGREGGAAEASAYSD